MNVFMILTLFLQGAPPPKKLNPFNTTSSHLYKYLFPTPNPNHDQYASIYRRNYSHGRFICSHICNFDLLY